MTARRLALLAGMGTVRSQRLFGLLRRVALLGMNYGADDPATSGEQHVLDRIARGRQGGRPVVFDVGANVGAYARLTLERLPDVELHCFEPSPHALERLRSAVEGHPAVHVHPFGLGRAETTEPFYGNSPGSELASVYPRRLDHHGIVVDRQGDVRLRRLDDVLPELGVERVDLLKLDVEGHELAVLEGAAGALHDGRVEAIQFEFGGTHIDARVFFQDFYYLLSPHYRIHRILRNGLWPIDSYREEDEVFLTANYLCLRRRPGL